MDIKEKQAKRAVIKDMMAYLFLMSMSTAWLFIFIPILLFGEYTVHGGLNLYEPNLFTLIIETLLCIGVFVLGTERLHTLIKRGKKK